MGLRHPCFLKTWSTTFHLLCFDRLEIRCLLQALRGGPNIQLQWEMPRAVQVVCKVGHREGD
eukprot:7699068-Prorocentrum_lima.AAC.1